MPTIPLPPGSATGIGSLPHRDAVAAAALVVRTLPDCPPVPQLPSRSPFEAMIPQVLVGVPEIELDAGGTARLVRERFDAEAPVDTTFDPGAHGGLLAFIDHVSAQPRRPRVVKAQVCGPLTLGRALVDLGLEAPVAYRRAAMIAKAWARAYAQLVAERLPDTELLMFLDEPGLVAFGDDDGPILREDATDLLSSVLSHVSGHSGVHVCGNGSIGLALDAGPDVVGIDVRGRVLDSTVAVARFLEGGGWVAWGAIPTDGPVGERAAPQWKAMVTLWCELTRRGCDGERLRRQALVTPACGLAGHGITQAERSLQLAREIGGYVREQAVATRLTIGA